MVGIQILIILGVHDGNWLETPVREISTTHFFDRVHLKTLFLSSSFNNSPAKYPIASGVADGVFSPVGCPPGWAP